ncbi:MAG: hypothetical protein AB1397_07795 [bacterium]
MKGKPNRLMNKLGTMDLLPILKISLRTFYRYIEKGVFKGYIKQDPISKDYYLNPKDLLKVKEILRVT